MTRSCVAYIMYVLPKFYEDDVRVVYFNRFRQLSININVRLTDYYCFINISLITSKNYDLRGNKAIYQSLKYKRYTRQNISRVYLILNCMHPIVAILNTNTPKSCISMNVLSLKIKMYLQNIELRYRKRRF